ncbi:MULTISPECIES: NAD(P)H-binding protein [unclassified Myroides]|uniref:NAD(P)H-binding protein n=1 Tax=unclassified Myroides TaxID=2642485 RepID=UPI0015FC99C1|nr:MULTISPECIES: NAD(P)H-binding protein [unclassified Myroides]MBB1149137.1 NAD(P)H-binding protein [Myroides sp. NP-2]MDM1406103.1 NAD(P)H-binding protein [Myroides sp. DF42-4-2]
MKNIGILGCGWLGLHLSQHLINKNYTVKGSTTSPAKLAELKAIGIDSYLVNLQDTEEAQLHEFLEDLDTLIITIPPIRGEESTLYQASFQRLIPYLQQHKVEKVIMMSSVSVYAPSETPIAESCTAYSNDPTSRQILAAEEVLNRATGLTSCILRLGGLFGPDRKPVRYIVNRGMLDNPDLPINMIHLNDIIQFTTALIEQGFDSNVVYNLVSPQYKNRLDYYSKEANELGLTLPPLGDNDWKTHREIKGDRIVQQTGIQYQTT